MIANNKVRHVKQALQTRFHTCHWPLCTTQVPPAMHMCKPHWFALPVMLRNQIWLHYKVGQEKTGRASPAYLAAVKEARMWIDAHHPVLVTQ